MYQSLFHEMEEGIFWGHLSMTKNPDAQVNGEVLLLIDDLVPKLIDGCMMAIKRKGRFLRNDLCW